MNFHEREGLPSIKQSSLRKKKKIMKFEYVLQIYWSKGLLINTRLQSYQVSFNDIFVEPGGFAWPVKNLLIDRFELRTFRRRPKQPINIFGLYIPMTLNLMFSQLTSVNATVSELTRYSLLRLYLVKTTRGRSHALGKPSRGQRTWSNAWTAYNYNCETRAFITAYQKIKKETMKEEKIDYRIQKKKISFGEKERGRWGC